MHRFVGSSNLENMFLAYLKIAYLLLSCFTEQAIAQDTNK